MTRSVLVILAVVLLAGTTTTQAQWGPIERLSETDSASSALNINNPLLAFGSTVLATWLDYCAGQSCLVYRRSADNGASWSDVAPLTRCRPYKATVALGSSGTVFLTYDSASYYTMFRRSTDNGASWSPADTLAGRGLLAANVDGYIQFVFYGGDDTLYWRRSTNNGASWSSRAPLRAVGSSSSLGVLVSDRAPYAYLVFQSGDSLLVTRTTDNGVHWDTAQRIVVASGINYVLGDVDNQGRVHIVWADAHTGNQEVYYERSTDNGATWSPPTRFTISNTSIPFWLEAKDANTYVSYYNYTTFMTRRRSFDGGASWEDETRWPSYKVPGHDGTCVCLGEGNWLHSVAYTTSGWPMVYRIEYCRSKDAGTHWPDSAVTISDSDPLIRYLPAIATSGSDVHVLWEDYKYGNYEIMYRRGVGLAGMEDDENRAPVPLPGLTLSAEPSLISNSTDLSYVLPTDADVVVTVLDAVGRPVRSLQDGHQMAGRHHLTWDGRDNSRETLPVGCYFCVLQAGGQTSSSKLLLTR